MSVAVTLGRPISPCFVTFWRNDPASGAKFSEVVARIAAMTTPLVAAPPAAHDLTESNPLDHCPACGRRISDFDADGCEFSAQRWCLSHHDRTAFIMAALAAFSGLPESGQDPWLAIATASLDGQNGPAWIGQLAGWLGLVTGPELAGGVLTL